VAVLTALAFGLCGQVWGVVVIRGWRWLVRMVG
jgi:hypothetical protein